MSFLLVLLCLTSCVISAALDLHCLHEGTPRCLPCFVISPWGGTFCHDLGTLSGKLIIKRCEVAYYFVMWNVRWLGSYLESFLSCFEQGGFGCCAVFLRSFRYEGARSVVSSFQPSVCPSLTRPAGPLS